MRVPAEVSSFTAGAMTARKVDGTLRFLMAGENSANAVANWGSFEPVWEFEDTGAYDKDYEKAPRAKLRTKWGDIYQGRRISWDEAGRPFELQYLITRTLHWRAPYLYWAYYDWYNVSGRNDWCIGLTELGESPASMRAHGPWRPNVGVKHSAGWLVPMPDGTLGVGAPLISGNIGSSWGPELIAGAPFPRPDTPAGPRAPDLRFDRRYVQYEFPSLTENGAPRRGRRVGSMPRDGNYVWHDPRQSPGGSGVVVEVNPELNGGRGSFTSIDTASNCTYIDLPDVHGILFGGSVAVGHVWYGYVTDCGHGLGNPCGGGQGPNASAFEPRWWIYDAAECGQVAQGLRPPDLTPAVELNPARDIHALQLGCNKSFGGSFFEPETRRLFMVARAADVSIPGLFLPLIHVFHIA